jgi:hypothetical protein
MTCVVSMKTCFVLYGREHMTGSYRLDEMNEMDGFRISLPDMESNVAACALGHKR